MSHSKKRITILVVISVLLVCGLILINQFSTACKQEETPLTAKKTDDARQQPETRNDKTSVVQKFKTKDEIKIKYGKIEIVNLYNGKTYEGAVLTTNEFYTIVTVDGTFKIPMKEVKLRTIIR